MKVALTVSECVPFAKTGGLADVAGALVKVLKKRRIDVCVIMPKYKKIDDKKFKIKPLLQNLVIPVDGRLVTASVWTTKLDRTVPVYFVKNQNYFDRDELYRTSQNDYPDNAERFIFFSRACLETLKAIGFQPDIIHAHDWQTGLIPAYLKTLYLTDNFFYKTATVYTIHNIAFQGLYPRDVLDLAGFSWYDFIPDKLEYYGQINFMKAGIVYANKINTVSETYAQQIQTSNEYGRGMEGILKSRTEDLEGIVNGIDTTEWDPSKDKYIAKNYSAKDMKNKIICKTLLCEELGWSQDLTIPVIGMVSRLDPLKGFDLIAQNVHTLMQKTLRLVILGRGDQVYESALTKIVEQFSDKIALRLEFNDPLAHKIYAGADMFLMPSYIEPCGLAQMIAMHYGTIPVVYHTGGLADTVENFDETTKKGNGIVFDEYNGIIFVDTLTRTLNLFNDPEKWSKIIHNAITSNFSWDKSATKYINLYKIALVVKAVRTQFCLTWTKKFFI